MYDYNSGPIAIDHDLLDKYNTVCALYNTKHFALSDDIQATVAAAILSSTHYRLAIFVNGYTAVINSSCYLTEQEVFYLRRLFCHFTH